MNDAMSRRHLLKVLTLISAGPAFFSTKGYSRSILQAQTTGKALVISSSNGLRSTEKAMQLIRLSLMLIKELTLLAIRLRKKEI